MDNLSLAIVGIVLAIFYGVTMKVADLLNEHGLKMFRGSQTAFGVVWGIFGACLVLLEGTTANVMVAMNIAFIPRNRLDYFNHQVAAAIIIVTFLYKGAFMPVVFAVFLAIFFVFGSLKDIFDDKLKKHGKIFKVTEWMLYYPVPTFVYALVTGHWILFWVFTSYTLAYNTVKALARKRGYV